jgi:Asp-tRNA(Asn)/Glu-tRNA(Gln) amidotransferase A subunit family amidase
MASGDEAANDSDRFGAFVARTRATAGSGPLSGLRVAVKDNIAVAGQPFTAGHPLYADRRADTDAACVRLLREAGASIVGVTRTDAGGFGVTTPEVENPVAPALTVGGSSGGSAAAVAGGLADVALGTDTGGSVRIPAACTGLIGFKPTRGRLSNDGVWPLSHTLDHVGLIGHHLDTIARTVDVLLGPDPRATASSRTPLRLGIDEAWLTHCDAAVATRFVAAVDTLQRGNAIVPIALPDLDRTLDAHGIILLAEACDVYRDLSSTELTLLATRAHRSLALAEAITAEMLAAARRIAADCAGAVDALFQQVDVILSPTLPCPVPPRGARRVEINGQIVPIVQAMITMTAPFNLSGHPALALPTGVMVGDLPLSIQLVGRRGADRSLIDMAHVVAQMPGFSSTARTSDLDKPPGRTD